MIIQIYPKVIHLYPPIATKWLASGSSDDDDDDDDDASESIAIKEGVLLQWIVFEVE